MRRPALLLASATTFLLVASGLLIARAQTGGGAPSDGSLPPGFQESAPQAEAPSAPTSPPDLPSAGEAGSGMPPTGVSGTGDPSAGTAVGNDQYVYDPTGRRDPFRPYRLLRVGNDPAGEKGEQTVLLEPLQTMDIDQLTILGILWDVRQPRALVQDANGAVHTLVKNTKIGRNNGYVAAIREGEVVVIEAFEDGERIVKRTRLMEFRK